ncbi:MAG: caspase family protein [Myxococcota bacterium]
MVRRLLAFVLWGLTPILLFGSKAFAQSAEEGPNRYAIVVGVSNYADDRIPDVPNAIADAKAIRDWFTTVGGLPRDHVVLLLDNGAQTLASAQEGGPVLSTRANVLEATEAWLTDRVQPGDTVFIYFSGQAAVDQDRLVLLPLDARDPLLADTGVDLNRLGATLSALRATPVWWLDTSFAGRGQLYRSSRLPIERLVDGALVSADQRVVWLAAPPTVVAPEASRAPHGAFTDALLRALRGGDGRVAGTELRLTQSAPTEVVVDRTTEDRFALSGIGKAPTQRPEVVPQAGHGDAVTAMAWHPARPWLASGDATGVVQIIDIDRQEIRLRFLSGRRGVYRLAFSPDGETLVVGGRDGVLRAWRTIDGDLRWAHPVSKLDKLTALAVHEDVIAVGTTRGRVIVMDAKTGQRQARFRIGESPGKIGPAVTEGRAWTDDAQRLISAGDNGELSVWHRGASSKFTYQRRLLSPGPAIRDLSMLDEGRVAVGLADGSTHIINLDDGVPQSTLTSTGYAVTRVAAGSNGRIAVAANDITVWTPAQGSAQYEALTLKGAASATSIAWTIDGTSLVSGHEDGTMVLWDPDIGAERGRLPGQAAGVRSLLVDEDRGALVVAGEAGVALWDLGDGQMVQRYRTQSTGDAVSAVGLVDIDAEYEGLHVLGGTDDGGLYAWNALYGDFDRQPFEAAIRDVAVLDEAQTITATDRFVEPASAGRWATGARTVYSAQPCGPEGSLLLHSNRGFALHETETGERQSRRRRGGSITRCSPDATQVAVGRISGAIDLYKADGLKFQRRPAKPLGVLTGATETFLGNNRVSGIAYHPTEPLLAAATQGAPAKVWDLSTGRATLVIDTFGTTAIAFAPGRLLVTGSSDGLVQFWDLDTGALVASLVSLDDDWLAWTPDGLFDGSLEGQRNLFRWRIGETLHPPSRFHRGFYEPGLLTAIAKGQRPRAERDIADLSPPPLVTILSPKAGTQLSEGSVKVEIAVADQGGGATEPRLYVNGHRVSRSGNRGLGMARAGGVTGRRYSFLVNLQEGRNHLRATAFNAEGNWEALGSEVVVEWTAPATIPPNLHVLAVGIDTYRNRNLDLDFARDDADAIGQFFEPGLFGEVIPHVLLDEEASLASIREAFETIAKTAAPRDAFLLYMAGHGVLNGEVFHFLPWDADVNSSSAIAATGFSQTELGDRLAQVPAAKQLVILDACHSGAASDALASMVGRRSSPGLVRAQHRLARSTGAFLIAASTEAQVAHEIPELGHGVLTFAILAGLGAERAPEAHVDRDGNVTVNTLIQYVSDVVPQLTETYRSQRQEVVQAAEGQDFPLVAP